MQVTSDDALPLQRLWNGVYWLIGVIAVGTFGYCLVEGWSVADSFFMTVITMSTVGYGETNELTDTGRFFTSGLIFLSLISMTGWTAILTSFIVECDLGGQFQRRKTARMIASFQDHTIVCGSGLMAKAVVERLARKRADIVVIDSDAKQLAEFKKKFRRVQIIEGDATSELNLANANLISARHIVAAMDSELDNLLIGITCKDIGEGVTVIARSNNAAISNRMRKAGIDEVISPSQLGGQQATDLILA